MFLGSKRHVLMDAAAGADGAQAAGAGASPTPQSPPNGEVVAASPAPGAAPAAAPNALAAATQAGTHDFVPEKHRVLKEDGSLDYEATLRKNAEAYQALSKRTGDHGMPPAHPGDYRLTPPDALKDALKLDDPAMQAFLTKMHERGLSQSQLDSVMAGFYDVAPKLVGGAVEMDADACVAELGKVWATPEAQQQNFQAADRAIRAFGGERSQRLLEKYGNDPDAIWLMAQVGAQIKESSPPAGGGGVASVPAEIQTLMASEAYRDPKHEQHAQVTAKVNALIGKAPGANLPAGLM